ncbi:hypothetical protein F4777DRAFT_579437 [Nemania sp. FL0916]|nr:hypothetical protein F4777DRAFT_579437 [Nemania sp. FL0916]
MGRDSDDARGHLLGDVESEAVHPNGTHRRRVLSLRSKLQSDPATLAVLALLLYIAVVLTIDSTWILSPRNECKGVDHHDSLPKGAIEYEVKPEWEPPTYPWNLEPSDELDEQWEDLLYALNVRVTADEIHRLHLNTTNRVRVNGGDYLGILGVYHHIHCLNNLRRLVHWDYYGPKAHANGDTKHGPFDKEHSDHCINAIRQAVMCHANTELHTAVWVENPERPMTGLLVGHTPTTCVRWDSLNNWARSRALVPGNFTYRPVAYDVSWA